MDDNASFDLLFLNDGIEVSGGRRLAVSIGLAGDEHAKRRGSRREEKRFWMERPQEDVTK